MLRLLVLAGILPVAAGAQAPAVRFQNRDAWSVEGRQLRVTILASGGHVGEIVLKPGGLNPLWIPAKPTIDPEQYNPARHAKTYGGGPAARLLSGLLGHNLCFPFWGNPTEAEFRAGMTFHGEAGIVRWKQVSGGADWLAVAAELPESRTRISRTVRVAGAIAYFEEIAGNLAAWDRPAGWCEHVTLGPPFLERGITDIEASLTRGRSGERDLVWPQGFAEQTVDLRRIRNAGEGFVNNFLVDPAREFGFFAAVNAKRQLLFGYIFRRADFPWLNVWEANTPQMLTRGMEFSNTPTHGTMKALVRTPELFQTPAFEWLDGRGMLRKRFAAFSARVPEGYTGVRDVSIEGRQLRIVERRTGSIITLEFDPRLL
jgi:hypothetical protein